MILQQDLSYTPVSLSYYNILANIHRMMMQQVQPHDGQIINSIALYSTSSEFLMLLKGYIIGYLGIPLHHPKVEQLIGMMDIYLDWIDMGSLSRQNAINLFLNPLKTITSFHNKSSSSQDHARTITDFQRQVEELVPRIMEDENYFVNATRVYNPKQDIMMSLNYTENDCGICSVNMEPQQVIILDCTHVYHFECLHQHVKNSIQSGQINVRCPSQYCGIELGQEELFNFMTPELEKKREDFMMNQYVERNGDRTSWCPTPDCNFLFQYDPAVTDFLCRNCCKRYCLKCRCEFHTNMNCAEYREYMGMNPDDQSFVTFARGARFKQCPRCRFWVQKSVGCVSMKCRCSQQFCYECGGVTCPHGMCSKNNALQSQYLQRRRI